MQNLIRISMAALLAATVAGCEMREEAAPDAGKKDGGSNAQDGGSGDGGIDTSCADPVTTAPTTMTVAQAFVDRRADYAEVQNAVVVAGYVYQGTGTFYVQDPTGGPGLAVHKNSKDDVTFPEVGDVVTVKGRLSTFSGSLQLSTSCAKGVFLSVTKTGSGTATSGAMPPAGSPTVISADKFSEYAHTETGAHAEQVGTVVQFTGPLEVTDAKPDGLVETVELADGGTKKNPRGFEITGGIWVDDDRVFAACIRGLDGGLTLPNGIRGVWERYNDFYGGTAQNPQPTYPVLKPLDCADLSP